MRALLHVSDHGFGHASRCSALALALLRQPGLERLTIAMPQRYVPLFFSQVRRNPRTVFIDVSTDYGIPMRPFDLWPNRDHVEAGLSSWVDSWDQRLELLNGIEFDLVIADASPLGCALARQRALPCALVSNFEWHAQFVGLGLGGSAVDTVKSAYASVTRWLRYPLFTPSVAVPSARIIDVPMCTRTAPADTIDELRQALPFPRVLLTMGGLIRFNEPLVLPSLEGTLIVTSGMNAQAPKAVRTVDLSQGVFDTLSYLAAADLVVTKAGWGTVAEAAAARKPMLVLRRPGVAEDVATLAALEAAGLGHGFDLEELDQAIAAALHAGLEPTPGLINAPDAVARACLGVL